MDSLLFKYDSLHGLVGCYRLIVWPRFPDYIYPNTGVFVYGDLFYRLLLVPIVLAPIVFILPLWSVHSLMARKAVMVRRDLDHLGERIDDLGRTLLNRADDLDPEQAERMTKSLDLMQQTYRTNQNIPMWPLNVTILTKFATSQVVPLLGFTGLGQPMLKVVDALAKFLGQ